MVSSLLLATLVGTLGCPQLLDDGFDAVRLAPDGGDGIFTAGAAGAAGSLGGSGVGGSGDAGDGGHAGTTAGGSGGTGGSAAGSGGSGGTGGSAAGTGGAGGSAAGTGGSGGTGGSAAGTGGSGGTGGSSGTGGSGGTGAEACRTFELTTSAADEASNCVGVDGWNQVTRDNTTSTQVTVSYANGDVCFVGTIDNSGWGAVYNYALGGNDSATDALVWNAASYDVTGFELTATGDQIPPSLGVTYSTDNGSNMADYCQEVSLASGAVSIPFADATAAECGSSAGSGALTDTTKLEALRLSFPVTSAAYDVDFCLTLRAL